MTSSPGSPIRPGRVRRVVAAAGLAVTFALGGSAALSASEPPLIRDDSPRAAPSTPFDGTPAAGFPAGEAGIALPAARTLPDARLTSHHPTYEDIPAPEVAAVLDDVRAALVETRLAEPMLVDHNPRLYIDTQAPHLWETWNYETLPSSWAFEWPTVVNWATKLADDVTPAAVSRVAGEITYEATTTEWAIDQAVIVQIETRFVWVYALRLAGEPGVRLVVIRDRQVFEYPADYSVLSTPANRGIHHAWGESAARVWGVDCDAYAEGLMRPAAAPPLEAFAWPGPLEPVPASC